MEDNSARAVGNDLSISTKKAIEICSFIRGKSVEKAKILLKQAIEMKQPIPFKRFTDGAGHKKGNMAGGKYPIKACTAILKLLESAEANASYKGLSTDNLIITHIKADKASTPLHYGRQRGRSMKRTHVEISVEEKVGKKPAKEEKPEGKKVEEKKVPEVKKETKQVEKTKNVQTQEVSVKK